MDEERKLQQGIYRNWTVNGTDCSFEIAVIDVGRPDQVRHFYVASFIPTEIEWVIFTSLLLQT